ncbi:MAG TPA: metalloregulator ArsR/SmtB family transcription factor [Ktedonobacterales bacterium]
MEPVTQADIFAAIAHPARRQILDLLADHERNVNEIARNFGVSRPAISQHLRILLDAGLVAESRHGRERRYRLVPQPLAQAHDWLAQYERFWRDRLRDLGDYLDTEQKREKNS